jgi:glucose-6-phosphate 1-dehydrogenase
MFNGDDDIERDPGARVEGRAPDLSIPAAECLVVGPKDPCTIVIFGASGDLTARKLVPALYNLYLHESLPKPMSIVGCSRTGMSHQEFRARLEIACKSAGIRDCSRWEDFAANLFYQPVVYDSLTSFKDLAKSLRELDGERHTKGNVIFYLAVPPSLYQTIAEMIGQTGLNREGKNGTGWVRMVVEKPFGRDLVSAVELARTLHRTFREERIFRIDHYLAKETVQSLLMFRFANAIFEPIWNRSYVDYVGIVAAEDLGVEHRAGYYEEAGVLRDMFQNHLMQLLALTAMEPPSLFEADRVHDEKAKVFRSLKHFARERVKEDLILGQYGPGTLDGTQVPAYREEPGVSPVSLSPTFAVMRVYLDNWRWRGVPFYLASGKRLARKQTEIIIQFKEVPHSMFMNILGERIMANRLVLGIYPHEKITLTFQTKNPGAQVCMRSVTMDFRYYQNYGGPILDAYEKVLLDCIQGDHMLFWRQDGVELSWSFLTPVLEECEACIERAERLHLYEPGSWGPEAAKPWMRLIVNQ